MKNGAPEANTLKTRPGLEALQNAKVVSGGFVTIAPMTRSVGSSLGLYMGRGAGGAPDAQQAANVLNGLPHKGQGPIFITTNARGGNAPRGQFSLNITKPAVEDFGALVKGFLTLAGRP